MKMMVASPILLYNSTHVIGLVKPATRNVAFTKSVLTLEN